MAKKRILIVDDNKRERELIATYLERHDFDDCEAGDGEEALKRLDESESIDLIILDIRMEPMDGVEFKNELKKKNISYPIVVLTAYGNDKKYRKAFTEYPIVNRPIMNFNLFMEEIEKELRRGVE